MPVAAELGVDDVLSVLTDIYQLEGKIRHDEFRILCPHPKHQDHTPSADVNLGTGEWKCFSCGRAGDLIILGTYVLGKTREEVKQILSPDTAEGKIASITRRIAVITKQSSAPATKKKNPNYIPPVGSYHDGPLDYMLDRRLNRKTLRKYGVRFVRRQELLRTDQPSFEVTNCIGIPICDIHDEAIGWCYRATPDSEPWFREIRYIYTPEVDLNSLWFGINHAKTKEIAITEGAIDSMWLSQLGIPAIAILGSNVRQPKKINQLSNFSRVTMFADRDQAGVQAVNFLGRALRQRGVPCMVVTYPTWAHGKDPQEMPPVDVELLYERAIPYTAWLHRESLAKN
jgi:hypothetical protein